MNTHHDRPPAPDLARWLADHPGLITPGLTTTTVLIAARVWSANGAEGDAGSAALLAALALGAAVAGVASANGRLGDRGALAGTCFAASGACAVTGAAAYADGLALPLLLWVLATAVAYVVTGRRRHTDRTTRRTRAHDVTEARERREHEVTVEVIRARSRVEAAAAEAYATRLAEAYRHRAALDTRGALTDFDGEAVPRVVVGAVTRELPPAPRSDAF